MSRWCRPVDRPDLPARRLCLFRSHRAHAYHQLKGAAWIPCGHGSSHRAWVGDYAVSVEEPYETPWVSSPRRRFVAALADRVTLTRVRRRREHSLEIQLPFLQRQLADSAGADHDERDDPVVPSAGQLPWLTRSRAAGAPGAHPARRQSDLHISSYDQVVRRDQRVADAVAAYDLEA